jgi:hypothetical protein
LFLPVMLRQRRSLDAVLLSMHEYERLVRLNVGEFQRFCDRVGAAAVEAGMTEDGLAELLADD